MKFFFPLFLFFFTSSCKILSSSWVKLCKQILCKLLHAHSSINKLKYSCSCLFSVNSSFFLDFSLIFSLLCLKRHTSSSSSSKSSSYKCAYFRSSSFRCHIILFLQRFYLHACVHGPLVGSILLSSLSVPLLLPSYYYRTLLVHTSMHVDSINSSYVCNSVLLCRPFENTDDGRSCADL